jgi:hypothetical protein
MVFIPAAIPEGILESLIPGQSGRMSREDLDELNRQIAIYKAGSAEPPSGLALER